ncbi:PQQ-binding-like beta-propeller repeat protein, partial [Streptomyces spiramenti]
GGVDVELQLGEDLLDAGVALGLADVAGEAEFGAPPQQPPAGAFGAPAAPPRPPEGSLSSPQDASGGFGAPSQPSQPAQPPGGHGAPAQPSPPAGGYGTPQPGGYGTPSPSGGYGTPQQPGGYGTPQPPGGYGYPQQPTPGYGYPQQPPAGYGYPGGPAGHVTEPQGFGAPTAPGQVSFDKSGGGSGGNGGGKEWSFSGSRGPLMVLMVGVVVSALVAGGFTVYNVTRDDSTTAAPVDNEDPAPGDDGEGDGGGDGAADGAGGPGLPTEPFDASLLFEEEVAELAEDELNDSPGLWFEDGSVIRVANQEVVSWGEDGEINWTYPSARGNCASSNTVSEGRIALLEGQNCEVLTVLDLADGEAVTNIELTDGMVLNHHPAILGDYVAMATTRGGFGWEIETGEVQWEPQQGEDCKVVDYGVHEELFIEHQQCGLPIDTGVPGSIVARDEAGEEQWSWSYEPQHDDKEFIVQNLVSVDPLVVRADLKVEGGGFADTEAALYSVKEDFSDLGPRLDFDRERHVDLCRYGSQLVCDGPVVHDGLLYVTTTDVPATVVAVEIATGNALWEVGALEDDRAELRPIGVQDDKVIAYQVPSYSGTGRVVAIDPATESAEVVMVMPLEHAETARDIMMNASASNAVARWYDNRLVLVRTAYSPRYETPSLQVYG